MDSNVDVVLLEREYTEPDEFERAIKSVVVLCATTPRCHEVLAMNWLQSETQTASVILLAYRTNPIPVSPVHTRSWWSILWSRFTGWTTTVQPSPVDLRSKPVGFVLGSDDDDTMIIEDMYGERSGGLLLKTFLTWAERQDYSRVVLRALPSAVSFYAHFGFKFLTPQGEVVPVSEHENEHENEQLKAMGIYDPHYNWYHMVLLFNRSPRALDSLRTLVEPRGTH
jgi:hypothetical protein